jgi:hypothetical protein
MSFFIDLAVAAVNCNTEELIHRDVLAQIRKDPVRSKLRRFERARICKTVWFQPHGSHEFSIRRKIPLKLDRGREAGWRSGSRDGGEDRAL